MIQPGKYHNPNIRSNAQIWDIASAVLPGQKARGKGQAVLFLVLAETYGTTIQMVSAYDPKHKIPFEIGHFSRRDTMLQAEWPKGRDCKAKSTTSRFTFKHPVKNNRKKMIEMSCQDLPSNWTIKLILVQALRPPAIDHWKATAPLIIWPMSCQGVPRCTFSSANSRILFTVYFQNDHQKQQPEQPWLMATHLVDDRLKNVKHGVHSPGRCCTTSSSPMKCFTSGHVRPSAHGWELPRNIMRTAMKSRTVNKTQQATAAFLRKISHESWSNHITIGWRLPHADAAPPGYGHFVLKDPKLQPNSEKMKGTDMSLKSWRNHIQCFQCLPEALLVVACHKSSPVVHYF